jgi:hypothetical protein
VIDWQPTAGLWPKQTIAKTTQLNIKIEKAKVKIAESLCHGV